MSLLYKHEHFTCCNYWAGKNATIRYNDYLKGHVQIHICEGYEFLFVIKGSLIISSKNYPDGTHITEERMTLLQTDMTYIFKVEEDVRIISFHIPKGLDIRDYPGIEQLPYQNIRPTNSLQVLETSTKIKKYLLYLTNILSDDFSCYQFYKLKFEELLFLMTVEYEQDELTLFFSPLLNSDISFSNFVFKHYNTIQSVEEFAYLGGYRLSDFEKKFKKIFGIPVNQWIFEKKTKQIIQQIKDSKKTISQLSNELGFSSVSQLNSFFKKKLGHPTTNPKTDRMS